MSEKNFGTQLVDMMKNNVSTSFEYLSLLQNQNEKFVGMLMEQAESAQAKGKEFFQEWLKKVKEGQDQYQQNLKAEMEKLEEFLNKAGE